jgi:hypothetical protein
MFAVVDGQLQHNGQPFYAVGCNYHPSASGCHYWQQWDSRQIDHDLAAMAEHGFNVVRFFLFWADFEPLEGQYNQQMFDRLREFVTIARSHHIACMPALLTIWMNGQLFDLPWRDGRNLWIDPLMIEAERAYVQQVARTLADLDDVLAYDLGDEVIHVDFATAQAVSAVAVAAWTQTLASAIRAIVPSALVLQANEASALTGTHAFRPEHSAALDIVAIHGYPVWAPFVIESIASYKASCFVPFLVQFARMHGAVLVDELGTYGGNAETARSYLRAAACSAFAHGARGIIAWCWQDLASTAKPYALRPGERFVGLLDRDGHPKPAMAVFQAFARTVTRSWHDLRPERAPIGVYVPEQFGQGQASYLQAQATAAPALFSASLLLKRAHLPYELTRGPLEQYQLVICPSMHHITLAEQNLFAEYVARGGVLYYSSADYLHGFGGEELFGVEVEDFTLFPDEMGHFEWNGQEYTVDWNGQPAGTRKIPIIQTTGAEALASYPNGSPALTCHRYGAGLAYYANAPFEQQLDAPFRLQTLPWHRLYESIAAIAHIRRTISADAPEVELAVMRNDRCCFGFVINHVLTALETTLYLYDDQSQPISEQLTIDGKGVKVVVWERESGPGCGYRIETFDDGC